MTLLLLLALPLYHYLCNTHLLHHSRDTRGISEFTSAAAFLCEVANIVPPRHPHTLLLQIR